MKIHIMGASCAGSTTLGMAMARQLSYPYFDTDKYFWQPSEIPFTSRYSFEDRNKMLKDDLLLSNNWILGGSIINWGDEWLTAFDCVVFLYLPQPIRMERLKARELDRYGNIIFTDATRNRLYKEFVEWATGYDDNTTNGRNLQAHQNWLNKLNCPVIEITSDTTVQQRLDVILNNLQRK
ncbi:adenylate kinase [Mucilaginibacter sp. OK098]|uniref:adenylate kinase n=1 Tax=Mucilaginibacter sp. OK098 TaxID=1855297 RepID=UPI0009347130|nr:adenylate kinase [Mucilaginibacter sp. OK098]